MTTMTLKGNIARESPGRNRRYAQGRICSSAGCDTKLSVYNPGSTCSLHTPFKAPIMRGRRSSPDSFAESGGSRSAMPDG